MSGNEPTNLLTPFEYVQPPAQERLPRLRWFVVLENSTGPVDGLHGVGSGCKKAGRCEVRLRLIHSRSRP